MLLNAIDIRDGPKVSRGHRIHVGRDLIVIGKGMIVIPPDEGVAHYDVA